MLFLTMLLGASCKDQIGDLCEVNFKFSRVRCYEYNFSKGQATDKAPRNLDFKDSENILGVSTQFYLRELIPKIKETNRKINDMESELSRCRFLGI